MIRLNKRLTGHHLVYYKKIQLRLKYYNNKSNWYFIRKNHVVCIRNREYFQKFVCSSVFHVKTDFMPIAEYFMRRLSIIISLDKRLTDHLMYQRQAMVVEPMSQ